MIASTDRRIRRGRLPAAVMAVVAALSIHAGGIDSARADTCTAVVSLPDGVTVSPGQTVEVPLLLSDVTGLGVISSDVTVRYDPAVLDAITVSTGPLGADCILTPNLTVAGEIRMSVFCTAEIDGAGSLALITFQTLGSAGEVSVLTLPFVRLNEGVPEACADDGSVQLCGGTDDDCDGLDDDCDGAADDAYPSLAFACAPPRCGEAGSRTCVGGAEVQTCVPGAALRIPDAVPASPGYPVQVPIELSDVGGQGVLSADLVVTWDPAIARATAVSPGSLTAGPECTLTPNLATPGRLTLSVFCTQPLGGAGTIGVVDFEALAPGGVSPLTLAAAMLNEGSPPACSDDGSLDVCAGDATLRLPGGMAAAPGAILTVPLEVSDTTGLGVLSADVTIGFDAEVLTPVSVGLGAVAAGCTLTSNLGTPGSVTLSIFCTEPRSGAGSLASVQFSVQPAFCVPTPLSLARAMLNEGSPSVCRDEGSFRSQGAERCDEVDNDCNGISDDGYGVGAPCMLSPGSCALPAHVVCTPDGTASVCRNDALLDVAPAMSGLETNVSWLEIPGAPRYDLIRGSLGPLKAGAGDFTSATQACLANDTASRSMTDADLPAPGEGWWYLMRADGCTGGSTYETGTPSQVGLRDPEIGFAADRCP